MSDNNTKLGEVLFELPPDFNKEMVRQMHYVQKNGISREEYLTMPLWELKERINLILEDNSKS